MPSRSHYCPATVGSYHVLCHVTTYDIVLCRVTQYVLGRGAQYDIVLCRVTQYVVGHVTQYVLGHVTQYVLGHVTQYVLGHVTQYVLCHVTQYVLGHVTQHVQPCVYSMYIQSYLCTHTYVDYTYIYSLLKYLFLFGYTCRI